MSNLKPGTRVRIKKGTTYDDGRDGGPDQPLFAGLTGQVEKIDREFVVVTLNFPDEQWKFYTPEGWYFYPGEIRIIPAEED